MLKKAMTSAQYVEDEVLIDVKYVQKERENSMVIDSGAPVSLVSSTWLKNYIREAEVEDESIVKASRKKKFRLGKTPYMSTEKATFPIVMETDDEGRIKREVTAHVIESDEVKLICGE